MDRKSFLKNSIAGSSALLAGTAWADSANAVSTRDSKHSNEDTFNLNYAPHFGMFRNHAGKNLLDQLTFMAEQGFRALEDNGMMNRSPDMQKKIGEHMAKLDMQMGVFVIDKGGNGANSFTSGNPEHTQIFVDACKKAVEVAKRVNAKWMTVVPGNYDRSLPIGVQNANVIETLRRGAEIFEPHDLVMVLEPLSDTPDLYLRYSDQTYEICKAVNSPSCKILYDIYHMQKNEGNMINNMKHTWEEIAYIQQGDVPGRKEPYTGEINFRNVFKFIYDQGFDGICGMEHGNAKKGKQGETELIEAYRKADRFKT